MSQLIVTQKGARRIRGGHLWIYKSDVKQIDASRGEVVTVCDEAKNFIGKAFYSNASEITLRFITTKEEPIDEGFWRKRIRAALRRREIDFAFNYGNFSVALGNNAQRLVYSEADFIPSLIVDDYNGVLVLQTLSQGTERLKSIFAEILRDELKPRAIIERNDASVRAKENLPLTSEILFGEPPNEILITQNGLNFLVAPLTGQKTGAFLDQRENYLAARAFAHGSALDCFTYGGGFALNIAAVCKEVIALDISEDAINLSKRNAELNNIRNADFRNVNVFDALREFERQGRRFDTVVLDPPAFVKNRGALKSAIRGYNEINLRALKLLNANGILVTCSCSFYVSEDLFIQTIEKAARDSKRRLHLLAKGKQASDHPILIGVPESSYLKCLIFRIAEM